jgi:hypothetical protein
MQGQYPGNRGGRPCGDRGFDHTDARSARLFLCAGCRIQVLICSCCDRGQIYCAEGCAQRVRRRAVKCSGQRYQNTPAGRRRHAARQARYRARDKKVTHHGSPPLRPGDLLAPGSPMSASDVAIPEESAPANHHALSLVRSSVPATRPPGVPAPPRSSPRPAVVRSDRMEPEHGDAA